MTGTSPDAKVLSWLCRVHGHDAARPAVMPAKAGIQYSEASRSMSAERQYYVYMLASRIGGTLYIGVTNDLVRRVYEHREKFVAGFTKKYDVAKLVYYEAHSDVEAAITREKQMKKWNRAWKIGLIEESNPNWDDLYAGIASP
jgi:putative endonuclease